MLKTSGFKVNINYFMNRDMVLCNYEIGTLEKAYTTEMILENVENKLLMKCAK